MAGLAGAWFDWVFAASWQLALLVGLVLLLSLALRDASPRLRHGLWLLVLLKAVLPPTLSASWAVGAWGVAPAVEVRWAVPAAAVDAPLLEGQGVSEEAAAGEERVAAGGRFGGSPLLALWALGGAGLAAAVGWQYARLWRATSAMRAVDEGPVRVEYERLAEQLNVVHPPGLFATDEPISPMLLGVFKPRIVLPRPVVDRLEPEELRMVLAHELAHWRRRDTWVGWLQVAVQCVYWFHPLVWLANARIRHERECACDEQVLRSLAYDRDDYGEAIVQVLKAARGRSLVVANMVGVFERGSSLQTRLEEIMRYDPTKRRYGWLSRAALAAAALVLLPMAAPDAQGGDPGVKSQAIEERFAKAQKELADAAPDGEKSKPNRLMTNWPVIVKTVPKIGATGVDPELDAISVTFDRDMNVRGYSWTGGGETYPPRPEGSSPVWIDRRTCQLPVELEKGRYYRVGINGGRFQNFSSDLGVPTPAAAIYFTTQGAKRSVEQRVRVPKIVKMTPKNGATDVDPGLKVLRVEFDIPMKNGFSWTGGGSAFPKGRPGQKPRWSRDRKTCTLPVELEPGKAYRLGINSRNYKNFASAHGVPVEPVAYAFRTSPAEP